MDKFKKLAIYSLISNIAYLIWLAFFIDNGISCLYLFLELAIFLLVLLFIFNHGQRRYQLNGGAYSFRDAVDIFITTKNESEAMLKKTIEAATKIIHPNKHVYILDDGDRKNIRVLAENYGCSYLSRPDRGDRPFKAANLNHGLKNSKGVFILTIDADQVIQPRILDDLLGYFKDEKIAFVSTRQRFAVSKSDFNNDNLFYEYMQAGKNSNFVGISCGSGVIYRRRSLEEIGGFQEWNIVEDLYTSYVLHSNGYKSIYVNQSYSVGDAPKDLTVIYKQRGTWALDTLRMFFWKSPLLNFGLSFRQRLHYFEIGYIYIVSAIVIPSVYILNFYSIYFNEPIVKVGPYYLLFKAPALYFTLRLYNQLGQGASSSRMWTALFPAYLKAMILALLYKKTFIR